MKIFLDTADTDAIEKAYTTGIFDGVTTNPTLIRKSGRDPEEVYQYYAIAFEYLGKFDSSEYVLLKGLQLLPDNINLRKRLAYSYKKQGKLDQAGIAALSGAIGWIPIIGDGISASLDLTNTGIDISRLQVPTGTSKKKGVKGTTRRTKLKV